MTENPFAKQKKKNLKKSKKEKRNLPNEINKNSRNINAEPFIPKKNNMLVMEIIIIILKI